MEEILVAAKRVADTDETEVEPYVEIPIRDLAPEGEQGELRLLKAYEPGEGQVAAFMATSASFTSTQEKVAGAINFLVSVLDEDDHSYIVARLFDRHDEFGATHVLKMIEGLMKEWTGRPTVGPSGSTPSRRSGGRKSTRPTPALT